MNKKNIYSNIELIIESSGNYNKGNSTNYKRLSNWNGSVSGNVTTIGLNGNSSYYNVYDMAGQVYQWTDSSFQDNNKRKILRGGCFASDSSYTISKNHFKYLYIDEMIVDGFLGFRVASYVNPNNYTGYTNIDNAGNLSDICDKRTLGKVNYIYKIMVNLVSNDEYCEFLNSVDPNGIYDQYIYDHQMASSSIGGIVFDKCSSTKYSIKNNMSNKPVTFITWLMASKYCNWLHNDKTSSWDSTISGAYESDHSRSSTAKYFIPSENEWYKAAYYDPNKLGTGSAGYWTYGTRNDDDPLAVICNDVGDAVLVEKQFNDIKSFPIIIRGSDDILAEPQVICPSISLSGYDLPYFSGYLGDNLTYVIASVSGLNPNQRYNYEFSSISSNWPCKISPLSGEFIADQDNQSINAVLQFNPQDVYNYTNFVPNLSYTIDPAISNRNFSDELYNNLSLSITTEDCPVVSDNTKIIKKFMLSSGTVGLPIVSQKDCAGISFITPSGSNQIEVSGSLCGQYVPLVMVVTNPTIGKNYNYTLSSSEPSVSLSPSGGTVSFGGGSGSFNRITSLLDLNGQTNTVVGVTLSRTNVSYSVSDYVSIKCLQSCEKSANNHANFDNKAIWGYCSPCSDNPPVRRTISSVTTVGTNGGPSSYGTYDQDGNILELCESFDISQLYRGGAFNSTILGKYARFTFDTDTFPNNYSDYIGFRIASYTNPYNYNNFKLVSDIGSPPTGNISDKDTGYGSVNYPYNIGEYPVTNQQYCEFLNSTSTTGINGVFGNASSGWIYNPLMSGCFGGIDRSGSGTIANPFFYTAQQVMENKPVRHVNKFMAFRYSNWLHNNKANGWRVSESGAYNFVFDSNLLPEVRASCAKYFVPNENEWYKAAYYDGGNTNNTSAEYWTYATQTNTLPGSVFASSVGNGLIPTS